MKISFKLYMARLIEKISPFDSKILATFLDNRANIYGSFLTEFENMSNAEKFLTQDLEDMLSYIAKTGRVL